jgi:hypothetical protein
LKHFYVCLTAVFAREKKRQRTSYQQSKNPAVAIYRSIDAVPGARGHPMRTASSLLPFIASALACTCPSLAGAAPDAVADFYLGGS